MPTTAKVTPKDKGMSKMSEISAEMEQEYENLERECFELHHKLMTFLNKRAGLFVKAQIDDTSTLELKETVLQGNHIGSSIVSGIKVSAKTLLVEFH